MTQNKSRDRPGSVSARRAACPVWEAEWVGVPPGSRLDLLCATPIADLPSSQEEMERHRYMEHDRVCGEIVICVDGS